MKQNLSFDLNQLANIFSFDRQSLHGLFDHIKNGVTITDADSKIIFVNRGFTEITGYSFEEAIGENPGMLHSGKHKREFYNKMWEDIISKGYWEGEIWNRTKQGHIYPEILTINRIHSEQENKTFYIAIFNDISYLEEDAKSEFNLAFYDPLTHLPNRNLLKDRFEQIERQLIRVHYNEKPAFSQTAVLFMDLNKFKSVNDTYGHLAGDALLIHVAKILQDSVRQSDTVARIGGDEFIVLMPSLNDTSNVREFEQRFLKSLQKPLVFKEHKIQADISIGATFYPDDAKKFEQAIEQSDKAMYHAKKNHLGLTFFKDLPSD